MSDRISDGIGSVAMCDKLSFRLHSVRNKMHSCSSLHRLPIQWILSVGVSSRHISINSEQHKHLFSMFFELRGMFIRSDMFSVLKYNNPVL